MTETSVGIEVIVAHTHADFDALASMVAAKRLYPQGMLMLTGSPDQAVREFLTLYRHAFEVEQARNVPQLPIRRLIICDTRVPSRLGDFREVVSDPQIEVIIFDHHPASLEAIVGDVNHITDYGATTTLLVRMLWDKGIQVSALEATLFCLGIHEETGSLLYPETTPEDVEAAAWCMRQGAVLSIVSQFMHRPLSDEQRELLNDLLVNSAMHSVHGYKVLIAWAECDRYVDELAVLASRLLDIQQADTVLTVVRMKERVYVVGRSQPGTIDVAQFLAPIGGGGHPTAASAALKGTQPKQLADELLGRLITETRPAHTAADVMSSPVVAFTEEQETVEQAAAIAQRFGFSGYPVIHGERLLGIVTRREIDRAMHHGMARSPLSNITSAPAIAVPAHAPLADVQRLMVDQDIGRVPVLQNGKVVGMLSRTDLLRAVHDFARERPSPESEVLSRVRDLPRYLQDVLEMAGDVGDDMGMPSFVVGGFVRDILLGVDTMDVDLVVEGDGIRFAETLAERLGGRVRPHEKFGTAVVVTGRPPHKLDVATARIEFYTRPAALPDVMSSPLKQDLYRRDFTINAMAIRLNRREYGRIYDFFGCRRDLREGVVRVLHNLSFIDDPTRIFRAIRFEQRYHFRMDPHTEGLLRQAVAANVFEHLSSERIRDEVIQILGEPRPLPAIKRMEQLKVLRLVHSRIVLTPKLVEILEEVTATMVQVVPLLEEPVERWLVYFTALVSQLSRAQVEEIAARYRISADQRQKLALDRDATSRVLRELFPRDLQPSAIARILRGFSVEMLLYLLSRTGLHPVKQKILDYLLKYRRIRPLVRGQHLLDWGYLPGPRFRELLDQAYDAQLDGRVHSLDDARRYLEHPPATRLR
ncbi:MAG: CBS domain-containing protein [Candidatus Xenobia bacterium]